MENLHKNDDGELEKKLDIWRRLANEIKKSKYLDLPDKQMFFLAAMSIKRVAALSTNITRLSESDKGYEKKQEELIRLLDNSGLIGSWHRDGRRMNLLVAKNKKDLDDFDNSFGDDVKRGMLLGYPETACEAYKINSEVGDEIFNTMNSPLLTHEEQDGLLSKLGYGEDFKKYLQVRLSRENFNNELKEIEIGFNLCKKYNLV